MGQSQRAGMEIGAQGGAGGGKLQDVFPWETQDSSFSCLERLWHCIPQAGEG